jgi:hypothetical protein
VVARSTQIRIDPPPAAGTAHVPQKPWRHEYGVPGRASRRTSRAVRPAGTSRTCPDLRRTSWNGFGVHRLLADEAEDVRLEPLVADQRHRLLEHLDEPAFAFGQRQVQDVDGVRGLRFAGDPVHRQRGPVEPDVPGVQDELLVLRSHDARPDSS